MKIEVKSITITIKWWQALFIIIAIILAFKINPGAAWTLLKLWLSG